MKARIKKDDLIQFKSFAKDIIADKQLPITSFIKIDVSGDYVSLTKTNCKSFVIHTCINDSEDCSFLIDETTIFNFIELSESEYINFKIDGYKITITDERNTTKAQTDNSSLFPKFDLNSVNEWVLLPDSVLSAAGICSQVVLDQEIGGLSNSVFIGDNTVVGCDGSIAYWQKFEFEIPKIVLKKNVAYFISKLKECQVSYNDSYNLFKSGQFLFGFVKAEINYVEVVPRIGEPKEGLKQSFYLNKSSFIKWNTYCVNTCKSKMLSAEFSGCKDKLELSLTDSGYDQTHNGYIDIIEGEGYFKFNPETINKLLRVLPSEQIYFYPGSQRYFISDSNKTFMSAIMLIN